MAERTEVTAAPGQQRTSCFCNHCNELFSRQELDWRFLCAQCRAIPGVRGYAPVSQRGLQNGGPEYWDRTAAQLNIVCDDDTSGPGHPVPASPSPRPYSYSAAPPSREVVSARRARPRVRAERAPAQADFDAWRTDVFADPVLSAEEKLYLLCLARFADWDTGANCFPSYEEQATALGLSTKQVRNLLRRVVAHGWVKPWGMRAGWRRTSALYQFRRPASASHGPWDGPVVYSKRRGATLTPEKTRDCPAVGEVGHS